MSIKRLQQLEHEGNEFSPSIEVRQDLFDDGTEDEEYEEDLELAQKEYMHIDNPALWDGEI